MQKAEAEFKQAAAAEARQKAEDEARHKVEAEAWLKSEAEAMKRAAAEAKQKAEADAAAKQAAEAAETALQLAPRDRQRIQVALTSRGFDTRGTDGVFGPRSREMIQGWQRARNQPATGFLTAAQQEALLKEAVPAPAK
jgi:peptidoglycan hydrolase-like protein with peptidoglycan-binding domain